MWPYAKQGARFFGDITGHCASGLDGQSLDTNDAVIKLWFPERLLVAVDALSCLHDARRLDVLRWLLFKHAYGRIKLLRLARRKRLTLGQVMSEGATEYRPRTIRVQQRRKSASDLNLGLSENLNQRLNSLAEKPKENQSPYTRSVLAQDLLHKSDHLEWQDDEAAVVAQTAEKDDATNADR